MSFHVFTYQNILFSKMSLHGFFQLFFCFLNCWVLRVLKTLYSIYILDIWFATIFSQSQTWLFIVLTESSMEENVSILINLQTFLLWTARLKSSLRSVCLILNPNDGSLKDFIFSDSSIVLHFLFKSMIHFEVIFVKCKFPPLNWFFTRVKNKLDTYVNIYFWVLNSLPLILCLSLHQYCTILITVAKQCLEIKKTNFSNLFCLYQNHFIYSGPSAFLYKF